MTHPATGPDGPIPVTIPAQPEHTTKSWAKTVHAVDADAAGDHRSKGSALQGEWLDRGATYDLPPRTLIVTFDKAIEGAAHVTLHQVTTDPDAPLTELKTWTNKQGIIGAQILAGISGRVAKAKPPHAAPRLRTPAPPRPNSREEDCHRCFRPVAAGEGVLVRVDGRTRVRHAPECPPSPPMRNTYEQACARCRNLVPAGEGILFRHGRYSAWQVRHEDGKCPPPAPAAPKPAPRARVNGKPGVCSDCLQDVPEGRGELHGGPGNWWVSHPGRVCPPHPLNPHGAPTWKIRAGDSPSVASHFPGPDTGEAARVQILIGLNEEPPTDAIGYRALEAYPGGTLVSFIAVGLASWSRRDFDIDDEEWYDAHDSIVRAATPDEAAPVLEKEATAARRRALAERTESLLQTWRWPRPEGPDDYTHPTREEMAGVSFTGLREITLPAGIGSPKPYEPSAYVDEPNGLIWTLAHNGLDGDDWAPNNVSGWIARSHPLTPERRQLIEDLAAEYGQPQPW